MATFRGGRRAVRNNAYSLLEDEKGPDLLVWANARARKTQNKGKRLKGPAELS